MTPRTLLVYFTMIKICNTKEVHTTVLHSGCKNNLNTDIFDRYHNLWRIGKDF